MLRKSLIIDERDNVAVLLENGEKGDAVSSPEGEITLLEGISYPHKVCLRPIKKDGPVYKYGEEIGYALNDIPAGAWIHDHNMGCRRGKEGVRRS